MPKSPPKEYREEGATSRSDYADPKQYKYPLHSESNVRAAVSYFSMPKNAGKYSSDEQRAIWGRIKSAAKRYGIELSDDAGPPSVEKSLAKADLIPGGKAKGKSPSDFDQKQLAMGIEVELEHTPDRAKAREIAMDHLTEFPDYYTRLKRMEAQAEDAKKSEGDEDEDEEREEKGGKMPDAADKAAIRRFIAEHGDVDDEDFHEFAEGRGLNVHEAEEVVYEMLHEKTEAEKGGVEAFYGLERLEKAGGEGSRGGKIIGHTAGGKPIYESHGPLHWTEHKASLGYHHREAMDAKDAGDHDAHIHHLERMKHHAEAVNEHVKKVYKTVAAGGHHPDATGMLPSEHEARSEVSNVNARLRRAHKAKAKAAAKVASKSEDNVSDLEKAGTGEGSRGGNIIGHTSSGKPIYAPSKGLLSTASKQHKASSKRGMSQEHYETKVRPIRDKKLEALNEHLGKHDFTSAEHREAGHAHAAKAKQLHAKYALAVQSYGGPGEPSPEETHKTMIARDVHEKLSRMHHNEADKTWGMKKGEIDMAAFDQLESFAKGDSDLVKSGGPFIGPRGGKWADPKFTIPWSDKKHAGKPVPKSHEHNEHGARELSLHVDNTEEFVNETRHGTGTPTQRGMIHKNLINKMAAGKYDHAQAGKLFEYMTEAASKHYNKEYGAPAGGGHHFDKKTRAAVARDLADDFHDRAKEGEFDHLLHKKYQKGKKSKSVSSSGKQLEHEQRAMGGRHIEVTQHGKGGGHSAWLVSAEGKRGAPLSIPSGVTDREEAFKHAHAASEKVRKNYSKSLDLTDWLEENDPMQKALDAIYYSDDDGETQADLFEKGVIVTPGGSVHNKSSGMSGGMPLGQPQQIGTRKVQDGGEIAGVGKTSGSNSPKATPLDDPGKGKRQKLSEDDDDEEQQMKPGKKPLERSVNKSFDPSPNGIDRERAYADAVVAGQLQKSHELAVGHAGPGPQPEPEPLVKARYWEQGSDARVLYSNAADLDCERYLEKGEAIPFGPSRAMIDTSVLCKSCNGAHPAMLTSCPHCGAGTVTSSPLPGITLEKSSNPNGLLRRPRGPRDVKVGRE
jgi:hypothetical protein